MRRLAGCSFANASLIASAIRAQTESRYFKSAAVPPLPSGNPYASGALCVWVAPMRMFSGGMPFTSARTLFPSAAGNPRKSALTIATFVASSASTRARTFSSPAFSFAGLDGPMPPDTGRSGSGVTTRTAMPARNSAKAVFAMQRTARRLRSNGWFINLKGVNGGHNLSGIGHWSFKTSAPVAMAQTPRRPGPPARSSSSRRWPRQ